MFSSLFICNLMTSTSKLTLGILGTGHLATYTVTGLRSSGDDRKIIVSPRNADRAANLVDQFDCTIAENNQAVIDQADIILLAVRPWQLDDLVADLSFPVNKIVVSSVAGLNLQQLRSKTNFPEKLALILPVVAAENAQGYVPIHPDYPELRQMANSLEKAIVFEQQKQFEDAATMTGLHGWLYRFFDEPNNWLEHQGIEAESTRQIVSHNTLGAAHYALSRPEQGLKERALEIARDGTDAKMGLDQLEGAGAFTQWSDALDLVKEKLDSSDD